MRWSFERARSGALALVAVGLAGALSGCETTAEKSGQLERTAHHTRLAEHGLSIAKPSAYVHVVAATLVRGSEGGAAVVTLRNDSGSTLHDVPIALTIKGAQGATAFHNNAPGLEPALTSLASLPAHGTATWVDDQVPASALGSGSASVSAIAGEASPVSGAFPSVEVRGVHTNEESGSAAATGTVRNGSSLTQQGLVVYVLARRAGKIVAAGRAVLAEVPAGASAPFQAFVVGSAAGAQLQASAPPSTFR